MGEMRVFIPVRQVELSAVVHRADGTHEDLGRIAYWHKNPLKRLASNAASFLTKVQK